MNYISLKIFKNSQFLKTKIFTDDQISIGSSEGLSLSLPELAPWQVLIEKKYDTFCILDLTSNFDTVVNGVQIKEETLLKSGDTIQIASYEIHFFIGPPQEKLSKPRVQQEVPSQMKVKDSSPEETLSQAYSEIPSFSEDVKKELPQREARENSHQTSKDKGFWKTYAPPSKNKNLEDILEASIGNLIEVNLAWKERILETHTFSKGGDIFIGGGKNCQIKFPSMVQKEPYKLISISLGAKIFLQNGVTGTLFQGKDKKTRRSHFLKGNQIVTLKPYEMLKLNFGENLNVYIRLTGKTSSVLLSGLFNFKFSESLVLLFAFLLTGLLFFYGVLYAPAFLLKDADFIESEIRVAKVVFEKKEKRKVVKYDMTKKVKTKKAPSIALKRKKPVKAKPKVAVKTPIRKRVKKISTPRKEKPGKMAAVAPGSKKLKTKKVKTGSARPGGSLKTNKKGSSAKTKAPDPTKVGLLGVFGSGGKLSKLDKGSSGPGGLTGLASQYTGFSGTKESYEGEGVGTKTKEVASGGQGNALVGISGIKVSKGQGLGVVGSGTGGLGERGRLSIEFSTQDVVVAGEIDRDAIVRVLKKNHYRFDRCYQSSLNLQSSLQGKMLMRWKITSRGKGSSASVVKSDIDSNPLKNCMVSVLESLIFPKPPSGQIPEVTFPFNFTL
ncbi:MAG: AgmX/PglI C-terminal domain-containing protein [Bdellovibrionales bacterium]|nr:AgmX/PglI C-terminal domain-containing protein [Bdellovibrionales bacterium]